MSSPILPPIAMTRRKAGLVKCAPSPAERRLLSCSRFRPSCRRDERASNTLSARGLFRDPYSVTPSIHLKLLQPTGSRLFPRQDRLIPVTVAVGHRSQQAFDIDVMTWHRDPCDVGGCRDQVRVLKTDRDR